MLGLKYSYFLKESETRFLVKWTTQQQSICAVCNIPKILSFVILQTYVAFLKEDTDKNVVNKTRAESKQVMRQPGNEMGG